MNRNIKPTRGGAGAALTEGDGGVSKSQSRDVLVCDGGSSVETAGLSGFSAAAAQKLIHSRKIHLKLSDDKQLSNT